MNGTRRVVVTGMGVVSCLGNSKNAVDESLRAGRSGIRASEIYAEMGLRSQVSGAVDIDLEALIDRKHLRFMGDAAAYAYIALQQAIEDAGLAPDDVSNTRTGLIAGSGGASSANVVAGADTLRERGVPEEAILLEDEGTNSFESLAGVAEILDERGLDVWHYRAPRIKTNEKSTFEERSKHLYLAVVHRETGAVVRVSGPEIEDVARPDEGGIALGRDPRPYLRERTWDGFYEDLWAVDLADGTRQPVATRVQDTVSRSPLGAYVVWFADDHFHLYDVAAGVQRNLTEGLEVSFADEDHDYPRRATDYGVGGWLRDESAVHWNS